MINVLHQETILHGGVGENGPLYTRLLAANPRGPNAGALLLTAEVYRDLEDGRPAFPIYRSLDGGRSWACIAQLRDDQLQHGHRHQPVIYELWEPFAGLPAGALLLAGNAIPRDMSSTQLVLYSSEDGGWSWTYRSSIDAGGPAVYDPSPQSTTTAVWEPELLLLDGRLVCFFADERQKHAGMLQAISMRSSTDLTTWTERVVVKGVADRQTRPGMFVSTGRMPDGWYRAVVEVVGPPEVPIHWLTSPDGLDWGAADDLGQRLTSAAGVSLVGTPNVHWRTEPSGSVTVLATGRMAIDREGVPVNAALLNRDGGRGPWIDLTLPTAAERSMTDDSSGYSQSVVWNDRGELVHATTVRNHHGSHDIVVTVAAH